MTSISRPRLEEILESIRSVRVGVIGDFTLDAYWFADMTRAQLSRETPLYPRPVIRETYNPGGAANVAWNVAALGVAQTYALTILGRDWRGDLLTEILSGCGVNLDHVIYDHHWLTPLFGKVFLQAYELEQEDARLDFVNTVSAPAHLAQQLYAEVIALLPELDALVVAEYHADSVMTASLRVALNELAAAHSEKVFLADAREQIAAYPRMVIKPNEKEAARLFFPQRDPAQVIMDDLLEAGLDYQKKLGLPFFITMGEHGVLIFASGQVTHTAAMKTPPPLDTVGAGDTFLACLAACLAARASPQEAAAVATLATSVTIKKLRVTGAASPEEILLLMEQLHEQVEQG